MTIKLKDVFPIEDLSKYKVHFAKWNQTSQPLDAFTKDRREWQRWQEYKAQRNDFNRELIFSLAHFYREPSTWLFGGVFKVLKRHGDRYEVKLTEIGSNFIGRLRLHSPYNSRAVRVNMESQYEHFDVVEILPEPFAGRPWPGYDDIHVSFEEIETLVRNDRPDWKSFLASVKGIYLITDIKTNKRYVGSASGEFGIWSRWRSYVSTGHGGNVELKALVTNPNLEYCRANFRFALLEHHPLRTDDDIIRTRENFWKQLLLTRGELGFNRN